MRISISNIAWDPADDEAVCGLLHAYQLDAIDIAPGKYFPDPLCASDNDIVAVRQRWEQQGIALVGMQSLLFGTQGLNLFADASVQKKMLHHLEAVSRIASGLGIRSLVFGSPKNRDRQGISDEATTEIATQFFWQLGNIAQQEGVVICLEPNPECYGANFMTRTAETADMVRQVNHPAIKMQLDTGAIAINDEDISAIVEHHRDIIGHIHLSEPNLIPLGRSNVDHMLVANALNRSLPDSVATIEMLKTQNESSLAAIEDALAFVTGHYRAVKGAAV
ncbi:MAG: TIM barrel protein [Pantoea sp.]|uniref:sugar phosphate isomerase/epimerase family protein n=1 Tax=Pantoea sp. TaxID=69393 RepID=UPI0039E44B0B